MMSIFREKTISLSLAKLNLKFSKKLDSTIILIIAQLTK